MVVVVFESLLCAKLTGRLSELTQKHSSEIFAMPKAAAFGNHFERQFAFGQQFTRPLEPDAAYFFMRRMSYRVEKTLVQRRSRDRHMSQNIADVDSFRSMLADEPHGFGDVQVGRGHHIGALPNDNS